MRRGVVRVGTAGDVPARLEIGDGLEAVCWVTPSFSANVVIVTGPPTRCWNTTSSAKRASPKPSSVRRLCSYWEPGHEVGVADCEAEWVADVATRQRVWELYRDAPAPLGYDFWSVFPDGPAGESPALLRLALAWP
jgi:hypothetical protein